MTSLSGLVPVVQRIARKLRPALRSDVDREDMAQEGFVGLMEAAARYEPDRGCSLRTFGCRRAAGAMMDHVRVLARHRREAPMPQAAESGEIDPWDLVRRDSRTPESKVMLARFRVFLRTAWTTLDGADRDVIRLRYFEGATAREAAEVLGISAATVIRAERRALDDLRARFLAAKVA